MRHPAIASLVLTLACASSSGSFQERELRSAEDTPQAFATEDGTLPVESCRSPLLDPRDHTRLRLVRSAAMGDSHRGDYEVPRGRYGVRDNELLRIDCSTGEVIGIVRNQ